MNEVLRLHTIFLCAFSTLMACSIQAQDSLRWTSDLRLDRNDQAIDLMEVGEGFSLRRDQFQEDQLLSLDHYQTADLSLEWSRKVVWPEALGKDARFVGLVNMGGRHLAFFQETDKKENKHRLFANPITPDGTWAGKVKPLHEVPFEKSADRRFSLWMAPDSSEVLVTLSGPFAKEEEEEHVLAVYDADLEQIWTKHLSLPYSDNMFTKKTFMLDGALNVHIFAGQERRKIQSEFQGNQKEGKNHILFSYYWEDNTLKELEVAIRNRWITDADAELTPTGLVGIGGFYSEGPYFNSAGTFCLMIDPESRRIAVKGMVPFTTRVKSEFMSEKQAARGREIDNLFLDHLHFASDSSVIIVGEVFDIQERVTSDPATGRQIITYTYRYEDLLATHMDATGKSNWTTRIPKSQAISYEHDIYSGYAMFERGNGLSFLFNDHPENEVIDQEAKTLVTLRKISLAHVELLEDGSTLKSHIMDQSGEDIVFRPALSLALPRQRAVLFAQYKRNYRLGLIDLSSRAASVTKPE